MLNKYIEAIETVNWLLMQTQPQNIKDIPAETFKELLSIHARLNWLLEKPEIKCNHPGTFRGEICTECGKYLSTLVLK